MITNVYIDGFNLYYGCVRDTPYKWLDLGALCKVLLPHNEIHRIRYFTAKISARPDDPQGPVRQEAYLHALESVSGLTIHLGHFLTRPARMPLVVPSVTGAKTVQVMKTEEKGSDVNLATYLVADAFRSDAECFVVISNDSDLKEPIRVVRHELGWPVGIINPHPPAKRSMALASCKPTFFKQIRAGGLASSQFPDEVAAPSGLTRKPASW